jgi:hypothetical protein
MPVLRLFQRNKCPKMNGHHSGLLRKKVLLAGKAQGILAFRIPEFPLTDWLIAGYTSFTHSFWDDLFFGIP